MYTDIRYVHICTNSIHMYTYVTCVRTCRHMHTYVCICYTFTDTRFAGTWCESYTYTENGPSTHLFALRTPRARMLFAPRTPRPRMISPRALMLSPRARICSTRILPERAFVRFEVAPKSPQARICWPRSRPECVCVCVPAMGQCYKDDAHPFFVCIHLTQDHDLFADHFWTSLPGFARPRRKSQD